MRWIAALLTIPFLLGNAWSADSQKPVASASSTAMYAKQAIRKKDMQSSLQKLNQPTSNPSNTTNVSTARPVSTQSENNPQKASNESSNDRWMIAGTFLIALFNLIMAIGAIWQANLIRNEFIGTFRPRIRVKHLWLDAGINDRNPLKVSLVVVNRGGSGAIIDELKFKFVLVHRDARLPDKILDFPGTKMSVPTLGSGQTCVFPFAEDILNDTLMFAIANGITVLYCVGDIQYQDELGSFMKTAFAYKWEGKRFLPHGDYDYAYED